MRQQRNFQVLSRKLRAALVCYIRLVVIIASLAIPTSTTTVKAQTRYIASPVKWFLDLKHPDDWLYADYVVDFEIPLNANNIVVYTTTAGTESRVLAFSNVNYSYAVRNGKRVVRVVTGYRARKCSSSYNPAAWTCWYTGSLYQWACSLRLRYYL
jgi:hypothetical protein